MYTQSLHGEIMSTFNDQSMSIGCVDKLGHLSGFLRHYLLNCLISTADLSWESNTTNTTQHRAKDSPQIMGKDCDKQWGYGEKSAGLNRKKHYKISLFLFAFNWLCTNAIRFQNFEDFWFQSWFQQNVLIPLRFRFQPKSLDADSSTWIPCSGYPGLKSQIPIPITAYFDTLKHPINAPFQ